MSMHAQNVVYMCWVFRGSLIIMNYLSVYYKEEHDASVECSRFVSTSIELTFSFYSRCLYRISKHMIQYNSYAFTNVNRLSQDKYISSCAFTNYLVTR